MKAKITAILRKVENFSQLCHEDGGVARVDISEKTPKKTHTQTQKSRKCVRGKQLRKYEWFENMFPVKKFKILTR